MQNYDIWEKENAGRKFRARRFSVLRQVEWMFPKKVKLWNESIEDEGETSQSASCDH